MRQTSRKTRAGYPRVTYGKLFLILLVMTPRRIAAFRAKISSQPTARGCLLWLPKTRNKQGYGLFQGSIDYEGFSFLAHRVAWALDHGEEPLELIVRHTCDNPPCCNPDHLILGTQADSYQDMIERGRRGNGAAGRVGPDANAADYTAKQRQIAIDMRYGERQSIAGIARLIGCARSTLYLWFAEYEAAVAAGAIATPN